MMKSDTKKQRFIWILAAGGVIAALVGCELAVDFDRSKIPVESVDGGDLDTSSDSPVISNDSGAQDAGNTTDASDAGNAVDSSFDAGQDTGVTDAATDANDDASD